MKYRTKLYLAVLMGMIASIIVALVTFSFETKKLVFYMLQSQALSIASTTTSQLDTELVEKANRASSFNNPDYIKLQEQLRKIGQANRRKDIFVSDLYFVYPDPQNPNVLLFGVESSFDPDRPRSVYEENDTQLILKNWGTYFTDKYPITDAYGTWLTGYAPVFNKQGKLISTLGVTINAIDINKSFSQIIRFALIGLTAALIIALIIAFLLAKKATTSLHHLAHVVEKIASGNLDAEAKIHTNDEFGDLADQINSMTKGLKERDRLKMSFARYVSRHVLDKILHSESPLKLEGECRKVTLLFSDIRQFTQLSESLPPEEIVLLLNEYFELMIEVIFSYSGTLDKFIGDGIMAEFGAPLDDQKQEEHAVRAAIEMQKALTKLCDKWEMEGKPRIQMGIGIHTGEAVVGNIGSERRTEYTAIGDAVNVASRLEQATKVLNTSILVSESTYQGCKKSFAFKDLGSMVLPGRKEQIHVFTIKLPYE